MKQITALFLSLCLWSMPWLALSAAERTVSITLDDLPYVSAQDASLVAASRANEALRRALRDHDAPADLFVVGAQLERDGETTARQALMRVWETDGHHLHNHSHTHPAFSQTNLATYLADVSRGEAVVQGLRGSEQASPAYPRFYRAPYNDLGDSAEKYQALNAALGEANVRPAPFTLHNHDWRFEEAYSNALDNGDQALAQRVAAAYLQQLGIEFDFAEQLSRDTFDREVPQILLLHANRLNADHLGAVLRQLQERGYRFVSLQQATADPAYAIADGYQGAGGISWLHRWRKVLGKPNRLGEEPQFPAWVGKPANSSPPMGSGPASQISSSSSVPDSSSAGGSDGR